MEEYKAEKKGGYYVRPANLPENLEVCRYCGHVYDPKTVKYDKPDPQAHRQLLEGDCPECGE